MGKSQDTFNKKEKEKKRLKKRQEKQKKKEERKANSTKSNDLDSMIAYTDEYGRISDTPADPVKMKKEIDSGARPRRLMSWSTPVFTPSA